MNIFKNSTLCVGLMGVFGFSISGAAIYSDAHVHPDYGVNNTAEEVWFPEISTSYLKQIHRYEVVDTLQMSNGLTKDQIRHIFGHPHFSEGILNVKMWNYVLAVRQLGTQNYKICQLRIDFEENKNNDIVKSHYWKGDGCAKLDVPMVKTEVKTVVKNVPVVVEVEKAIHILPEPKQHVNVVFNFDRSDAANIVGGVEDVQVLAGYILADQPMMVYVAGYADRLGNAAYNKKLSEKRAATVTQLLQKYGIDGSKIKLGGLGSTEQFKQCQGGPKTAELTKCLEENRRVEVKW